MIIAVYPLLGDWMEERVSIPSDAGNTWYVCRIEAGSVRITNYMAEESASYAPK